MYLFLTLNLHNTCIASLSSLESLALRPNQPSPLDYFVTPEPTKLFILLTSLYPTLKDSLLIYLDHLQCLCNTW